MLRWFLASVHLFALGIGLGAIWVRARGCQRLWVGDSDTLRRIFAADTTWGIAAFLWISTGLIRAFGGFEKGTNYYLHNHYFLAKMGFLVIILALEIWPMMTLIRWRRQAARGGGASLVEAKTIAKISYIQAVLIVMMVFAATAIARGFGR